MWKAAFAYDRAAEDLSAILLEHTPHDACRMRLGFKRVEHFKGTSADTRRVAREMRLRHSQDRIDREQAACIASRRVVIEINIIDLDRRIERHVETSAEIVAIAERCKVQIFPWSLSIPVTYREAVQRRTYAGVSDIIAGGHHMPTYPTAAENR